MPTERIGAASVWRCALLLIGVLGGVDARSDTNQPPEPEGYRLSDYDAPVPATLTGAVRVSATEIQAMRDAGRTITVVDVIPEHRRPDNLPENQIWIPVPHTGVKDALWLPDVGFGALSETTESYFRSHLEAASGGDPAHPFVFYCRIDCWMSWNAAKRALSYGYSEVYWFADGIDDWRFEDLPTETLTPATGLRH